MLGRILLSMLERSCEADGRSFLYPIYTSPNKNSPLERGANPDAVGMAGCVLRRIINEQPCLSKAIQPIICTYE